MNIRANKTAARIAAAAGLLVSSSVAGCSSTDDGANNTVPQAGSPQVLPGGGSGGSSGGASAGTGGATGGSAAGAACPGNQINTTGMCMCPAYATTYCEAITKCVNSMKDPDHCGGCDTLCSATQACNAGACTPELMPFADVAGCGSLKLVQAAGKLYVLSTMDGALSSIALPAGGAPAPITTGLAMASAFVVDAMNAYVVTGNSLTRVVLAGGAKEVVVTETTPIFDVAVAAGKLYYAVGKDVKMVDATASAGTGVSVALGIDEGEPQGVAVSGEFVLYASAQAMNVELDPIAGEGHVKLGASQGGLKFGHRSVQTDGTSVFWINSGIQSAPIAATMGTEHPQKSVAVSTSGDEVAAFAVNASTVYFTSGEGGVLEKATFGAEEATPLARGLAKVGSIVLDDANVYVATECKIVKGPL